MIIDRGLNDRWVKPELVREIEDGEFLVTLSETLGRSWKKAIVSYPLAGVVSKVRHAGKECLFQSDGKTLEIQVDNLQPGETREYRVSTGIDSGENLPSNEFVKFEEQDGWIVADNGKVALRLPKTGTIDMDEKMGTVPGPIAAVRIRGGVWFGEGFLKVETRPLAVESKVVKSNALTTIIEITYSFPENHTYVMSISFFRDELHVKIDEKSTLPIYMKPLPRPYSEIGSLGKSFWDQPLDKIAEPCVRQYPADAFIFTLSRNIELDRMQTHSTASWEIMDLPLYSETPKSYTAMRPVNPFMDGGWICFYSSKEDDVIGFSSINICDWKIPDETLHPIHRTPGASTEIICHDSKTIGAELNFPIQNIERSWVLNVASKLEFKDFFTVTESGQPPVKVSSNSDHPTWALRNQLGDYRLDKVKDWIVDWPDINSQHPTLLCKQADFKSIRETVKAIPELYQNYEKTKDIHSSDRYIIENEASGLAVIEQATNAKKLVKNTLDKGYIGPNYSIHLARPLRRYVIACDIEWNSFSEEEKKEARRVCTLAAYILSDGDYWQYAWKPDETTYLPNFNTDVFTCYGLIGLFLDDHPCSKVWTDGMINRLELDLKYHIREDGCGEENLGNYNISSWTQLWLPVFWALKQNGVKDYSNDPRIHAAARFFLDILSPADPRNNGIRYIPPIGHHPMGKKDAAVCSWFAAFINDYNPELASNLMWFWNSSGKPVRANGDHSGPESDPHTLQYIFHNPEIKPLPYKQESKLLPNVGIVFHSYSETGKGSYLLLKAGRVHSHHDADEGSFHYFGRGVPLALDGLPLMNLKQDGSAEKHNVISFDKPGRPGGRVKTFVSHPECDYVFAELAPRHYDCDAMYIDNHHRSGFNREIIMVKASRPGGIEYLVLKDTAIGPDSCQWNLDVLSRKPILTSDNRIWFPGHEENGFQMGLEVIMLEPEKPEIRFEEGILGNKYKSENRDLVNWSVNWSVVEHWMAHAHTGPGTTFLTVLFPRKDSESSPDVTYIHRDETLIVRHDEGKDIIFVRSNNDLPVVVENIKFHGRTGATIFRNGKTSTILLDGKKIGFCKQYQEMSKFLKP